MFNSLSFVLGIYFYNLFFRTPNVQDLSWEIKTGIKKYLTLDDIEWDQEDRTRLKKILTRLEKISISEWLEKAEIGSKRLTWLNFTSENINLKQVTKK